MNIEQLKKEYDKKFRNKRHFEIWNDETLAYPYTVWKWIEKEIIPTIIKEMLVEEREVRDVDEFSTGHDMGHNQCCAIGRENAKALKEKA